MPNATERERQKALSDYDVLDSLPEAAFDRLTELAADLFETPIALVSLIDADRQWFKSRYGLDAESTPRDVAFCDHAIRQAAHSTMVVEDATRDPRFSANPLVTGAPDVCFYAGAVLTTPDGHNIGTLCIIDHKPRSLSDRDRHRLSVLARMVMDELELRRSHRLAAEKQKMLELAERMSGVGHWRYDVATRRLMWSDGIYRVHGVTPETYDPNLGDALSFFPPAERRRVQARFSRALETGQGYAFEMALRRADGVLRQVACKADSLRGDTGEVTALYGVFQDITERKAAEATTAAARRAAEEQSRRAAVAEAIAGLGHWRLDLRTGGVDWSEQMYRIYGMDPGAPLDLTALMAMTHPDDAAAGRERLRRQIDGETEGAASVSRIINKAGETRWLEGHSRAERDAKGRAVAMVGTAVDITEQKRVEMELRQARLDAEAATAAKADFLANMSHELRTPLTAILGFTGLLSNQPELSSASTTYVGRVQDASTALLGLVTDILDFSKLESGQVTIHRRPVAIAALCQSVLDMLAPLAAVKGLSLALDVQTLEPDLTLSLDPDRLRQVLLNLAGNAVKFTQTGGVTLRAAFDAKAKVLTLGVADTGVGIAADQQDRLFKRFSQIDNSSTRSHGGTGLGLAICKGLVEAMGGEIGVQSTPGRGSLFHVSIPASRAASRTAGDSARPSATALDGVRVLVADDRAPNRELARALLAGCGAEVEEACDGQDAVDQAMAMPFDVILLDLHMPRMDGREALEHIRGQAGPNDNTPILALTAAADGGGGDGLGAELRAAGFEAVVPKPIEVKRLIAAVAAAANADSLPEVAFRVA